MSKDWREVMGVKKWELLTPRDLAHLDALWAQASLEDEDHVTYLAGIGALWPALRPAVMWEITNRAIDEKSCEHGNIIGYSICPHCDPEGAVAAAYQNPSKAEER
jgi:hypothetical protein